MKAVSENQVRQKIVGKFFRERRVKAGLTQRDVADHMRYSTPQFVSNWERGMALPPAEAIPRLASLFGVSQGDVIQMMDVYHREVLKLTKKKLVGVFRKHIRQA